MRRDGKEDASSVLLMNNCSLRPESKRTVVPVILVEALFLHFSVNQNPIIIMIVMKLERKKFSNAIGGSGRML